VILPNALRQLQQNHEFLPYFRPVVVSVQHPGFAAPGPLISATPGHLKKIFKNNMLFNNSDSARQWKLARNVCAIS
jgi:hypothetical protein